MFSKLQAALITYGVFVGFGTIALALTDGWASWLYSVGGLAVCLILDPPWKWWRKTTGTGTDHG